MVYSNTVQSLVAILRAMSNLLVPFGDRNREVIFHTSNFNIIQILIIDLFKSYLVITLSIY